jgi:septal ring factor EnvC (AmiA/AmiB activator)
MENTEEYWKRKFEVMQNYYSVLIAKNVVKIEDTCKSLNDLGSSLKGFEEGLHKVIGELIEVQSKSRDKKFKKKIEKVVTLISEMREMADNKSSRIHEIVNSFRQTL